MKKQRKEILNLISDDFLLLFKSNLEKIFPHPINKEFATYNTGTLGWNKALNETCNELNCTKIKEYCDSLAWDEWDVFSDDLGELMIEHKIVV